MANDNRHRSKQVYLLIVISIVASVQTHVSALSERASTTDLCGFHNDVNWSPDGKQLVFVLESAAQADIWLMDSNGANPKNLTQSSEVYETNPVWSPDGKWIAHLSRQGMITRLWIVSPDGAIRRDITPVGGSILGRAAWSPDGHSLAIPVKNGNYSDVWIIGIEERTELNVTQGHSQSYKWPSWSTDGKLIAFTTFANDRIVVATSDGAVLTDILTKQYIIRASWSPTSAELLFEYADEIGGNIDIWKVSRDGSNPVNLTEDNLGVDFEADWSPDGSQIAFKSTRNGQTHLWVMGNDGQGLIDLTPGIGNDIPVGPSWSPKGEVIAFTLLTGISSAIWTMNSDGSNLVNLSATFPSCD